MIVNLYNWPDGLCGHAHGRNCLRQNKARRSYEAAGSGRGDKRRLAGAKYWYLIVDRQFKPEARSFALSGFDAVWRPMELEQFADDRKPEPTSRHSPFVRFIDFIISVPNVCQFIARYTFTAITNRNADIYTLLASTTDEKSRRFIKTLAYLRQTARMSTGADQLVELEIINGFIIKILWNRVAYIDR